jgi:hypothetical protein
VFDRDAPFDMREKVNSLLEKWGVDPGDQRVVDFVKTFMIYRSAFPLSESGPQYKIFYNVVSVPGIGTPPESFATRNTGLFNAIFTVRESKESAGRWYYLVSSRFCFPVNTFELFVDNATAEAGVVSLNETIEFNTRNGMLSKYGFVNDTPKSGIEAASYNLKVVPEFSKTILDGLGSNVKDNRINERVSVKMLSEYPYAYNHVKSAFNRFGIDYRDIPVVLVYMPNEVSTLGGYLGAGRASSEAVKLASEHSAFKPPFIIINVANTRMHNRETLSNALIHEGRHFLDDILVSMGMQDSSVMGGPKGAAPKDRDGQIKDMMKYLSTPTEINAHAEQAMTLLKHYDLNYLMSHWPSIKNKIIREEFTHGEVDAERYPIVEGYAKILDRALELYVQDSERDAASKRLLDQSA